MTNDPNEPQVEGEGGDDDLQEDELVPSLWLFDLLAQLFPGAPVTFMGPSTETESSR